MSAPITPDKAVRGEAITANGMNELLRAVLRRIRGGRGVVVNTYGDGIVIETAGAGGVGGITIPWVTELPPIPVTAQTTAIVFWATADQLDGATGDGQAWIASTGQERWRRLEGYSNKSGVPVEPS
jgi:class 3 adenylate cyclase